MAVLEKKVIIRITIVFLIAVVALFIAANCTLALQPSGSVVINGNDEFTNSTTATINLSVQDFTATEVSFSNNGVDYSLWESFVPLKTWNLTEVDELKTVYVRFRNLAGDEILASDNITLDMTSPIGGLTINSGQGYTSSIFVSLSLSASDPGNVASGIDKVMISDNKDFALAVWQDYSPILSYTLSGFDAEKIIYTKFKDIAGNESGLWKQDDWIGGSGQAVWNDNTKYAVDSGELDISSAGSVKLGQIIGSYSAPPIYAVSDGGVYYTTTTGEYFVLNYATWMWDGFDGYNTTVYDYLKFPLSSIPTTLNSATLYLNAATGGTGTHQLNHIPDYGTLDASDYSIVPLQSAVALLLPPSPNCCDKYINRDITTSVEEDRVAAKPYS
ncbi:hypothetical protein LCGC14_1984740, partial [marine sediment metagenome]